MVRIAGGADVARGSESARSASRLLANAPDVAYGVTINLFLIHLFAIIGCLLLAVIGDYWVPIMGVHYCY